VYSHNDDHGKAFKPLEGESKIRYWNQTFFPFFEFLFSSKVLDLSMESIGHVLRNLFEPKEFGVKISEGSEFMSYMMRKEDGTLRTADFISHCAIHMEYFIRLVTFEAMVSKKDEGLVKMVKTNQNSLFKYVHEVRNLTRGQVSIPKARCSFTDESFQSVIVDGVFISFQNISKIYFETLELLSNQIQELIYDGNIEKSLKLLYQEDYRNSESKFTSIVSNFERNLKALLLKHPS